MEYSKAMLYEAVFAHQLLQIPGRPRFVVGSISKKISENNGRQRTFYERFVRQCLNFEVHPVMVLKVMFSFGPTEQLYASALTGDYAWKRFHRNYEKLKDQYQFSKSDVFITAKKIDTPERRITVSVKASIQATKSFASSYPTFTLPEIYSMFSESISPYHLSVSRVTTSIHDSKELRRRITKAKKEILSLGMHEDTFDLVAAFEEEFNAAS